MGRAGRPSRYSPELVDTICDQISEGNSLRSICLDPDMPGLRTVLDWLTKYEEFRDKYARAREQQAEVMDDKILAVADSSTAATAHSDRVKIDAYKWRAAKLCPKKYGDKQAVEVSGPEGGPIQYGWGDAPPKV